MITLNAALEQLEEAELLSRRGTPPEASYSFKHALVQEAAYASLLKSRRQTLHRRIGEVLRDQFRHRRDRTGSRCLSLHRSGPERDGVRMVVQGRPAGAEALGLFEAIAHLGKAVAIADELPDAPGGRQALHQIAMVAARRPPAQRARNGGGTDARPAARRRRQRSG